MSFVNLDGWGGGYGNYLLITHGNGYATLYAHLSAVIVLVGQAARQGQPIGAEGSTGFPPARTCTSRSASTASIRTRSPI